VKESLKDSFISERTSTRIKDKWDMRSVVDDANEIAVYLVKLVNNKRKPRKEDIKLNIILLILLDNVRSSSQIQRTLTE